MHDAKLRTWVAIVTLATSGLAWAGCGGANRERSEATAEPEEETMTAKLDNKTIVRTAMKELLKDKDTSALRRYWGEPYIQHNPTLPDGVAVLEGLVPATESWDTARLLGDGEYVVSHSRAVGWGPEPMIVFDVFRLADGRMVEHWDIMQPEAKATVSGRTQLDGATEVSDLDRTEANRRLVKEMMDVVLIGGQGDKVTNYISTAQYLQHNPGVGDGLEGFGKAMQEMAKAGLTMKYEKVHRVIAEGNFVFTHSEGEFGGKRVVFADLFRVDDGKIVEHWDCIQPIPAESKNDNGMF